MKAIKSAIILIVSGTILMFGCLDQASKHHTEVVMRLLYWKNF